MRLVICSHASRFIQECLIVISVNCTLTLLTMNVCFWLPCLVHLNFAFGTEKSVQTIKVAVQYSNYIFWNRYVYVQMWLFSFPNCLPIVCLLTAFKLASVAFQQDLLHPSQHPFSFKLIVIRLRSLHPAPCNHQIQPSIDTNNNKQQIHTVQYSTVHCD